MINFRKNSGFSLIEVVVASAIISISVFAVMASAEKGVQLSSLALKEVQAGFLLEEGAESIKIIRNSGWSNITSLNLDTNYYLSFDINTNLWNLSTTPNLIDGEFTRKVYIESVNRNENDDISESGTLYSDPRTKKVTITVSWGGSSGPVSKNLIFYITDIFS